MSNASLEIQNWFDHGGRVYKRFRPEYPSQLGAFLASCAPDNQMAVDVGCGNGQLTRALAPYFRKTLGLDPSLNQIANSTPNAKISYLCSKAEHLPIADGIVSLVTAAQAAHWFDLPAFYKEVRRIGTPGAIVALISYGVLSIGSSSLNDRFQRFYWEEVGPYWPPERKLVETGYQTIDFPFKELSPPPMEIRLKWDLTEFLGYLSTWSAVRVAEESGHEEVLRAFANDIASAWGGNRKRHYITWPVNMRIGRE